ncbi:hypothetical protein [Aliikangiella coralliicola]|uniref:Endonuclease/exonuclease/phosphatase domain-containing protein n=1 Tax=Aliikangiella coralliicola TaxID=2592383 RepID=A0A545UE53_9GAMM|nr:hypothetical protein [Aliikangiella coralliicola]TQV87752.1 hypothetical protein FLL46_10220 [Aliikangiella coralliicola]
MKKIIFWNIERLSPNQLFFSRAALKRARSAYTAAQKQAARKVGHEATRAVTRSSVKKKSMSKFLSRESRNERRSFWFLKAEEDKAESMRNKYELSEDLPPSAHHAFYCEVGYNHGDRRSPRIGATAAGSSDLCYAYYANGASSAFTHCPITAGWCGAPPPAALGGLVRVPKSVSVVGTAGPVRFCFWHAPSGNNGAIVAQVYNALNAHGAAFVLFGDLNAEPDDLIHQGVPGANILDPGGATRISGRCLDYAVTNVPNQFHGCRPLYNVRNPREIKIRTGSDHMPMVLELR